MPVIAIGEGLLRFAHDWAIAANASPYSIGLYSNDWYPQIGDTLSDVTPASWSGYDGLRTLPYWDVVGIAIIGPRAVITHPAIMWVATGVDTGDVYGYYVQSDAGELLWASRYEDAPTTMGEVAGQTYTVTPRWSLRSEYEVAPPP